MDSRRAFLKLVSGTAGAMVLAVHKIGTASEALKVRETYVANTAVPEFFIRINKENLVEVVAKHLEMGQGVLTGIATIVAEELGASWSQMRYSFAPADTDKYKNLRNGLQGTGGSQSIAECWEQMRTAGAAARQMLVTAAANDWRVAETDIVVREGLLSHLATGRIAPFGGYAEAAAKLPIPDKVVLTPSDRWRLIGHAQPRRLEGADKSSGAAIFGLDVRRSDMVHAVIARSPRFGGRLAGFDATASRKVGGVLEVFAVPTGVAVVARDSWSALKGRERLQIRWDDTDAELRSSDDILREFRKIPDSEGKTVATRGDCAAALNRSARSISAEYSVPLLAHATMEPLNVVVDLQPNGADLWGSFQIPTFDHATAARILALKPSQVRLHNVLAGGSFGRRTTSDYIAEACAVAKGLNRARPVQIFWSRSDDLQSGYYRPHFLHRLRAGIDSQGRVLSWQQQVIGPSIVAGTAMEFMARDGVDKTSVDGANNFFYGVDNRDLSLVTPNNRIKLLAWRSVGHTHTAFAMESFIDEIAHATKADPLFFRLKLLQHRPEMMRLLNLVAEKSGWGKPLPKGYARGVAIREAFNTRIAQVAEVEVGADQKIKVHRIVNAIDCGTAVNPNMIAAQLEGGVAWGLGPTLQNAITLRDGVVEQSNFDTYEALRFHQMPAVEVHIMTSNASPTGVGELGVPGVAPAVANAVFAATGRRLRDLPLKL